jgi:hypothetical protein
MAFLRPRANAEMVPKFHVALHASHAVASMLPGGSTGNFALHYRDFEIRGPGPPGWWSLR